MKGGRVTALLPPLRGRKRKAITIYLFNKRERGGLNRVMTHFGEKTSGSSPARKKGRG